MTEAYDSIIVGGGPAGRAVASRVAQRCSDARIAWLEAGPERAGWASDGPIWYGAARASEICTQRRLLDPRRVRTGGAQRGADALHETGGALHVADLRTPNPVAAALLDAAVETTLPALVAWASSSIRSDGFAVSISLELPTPLLCQRW
jgi:hypothetical protein